jgi:carboxyl-terminal processing protease
MLILKKRNLIFLLIAVFLAGSALPVGANLARAALSGEKRISNNEFQEYAAYRKNYGKLMELDAYIKERYYLPIEDGVLETGAYKGIFSILGDDYTIYYTPEEYKQQNERTQGEFSGVGLELYKEGDEIAVRSVFSESAAELGGLAAGDLIVEIDGENCGGWDLTDAALRLRGDEGTDVIVRVRRGEGEFEKTLTRSTVVTPSVAAQFLDGGAAYIRIMSFTNRTADDFRAELQKIEEAQAKGLVIDLRDNAGGLVDKGVEIADMLLGACTVAAVRYGDGAEDAYVSEDGATEIPYVLLVNSGTASTSEILAGAVKDNGGGRLVGVKTTGKGILQRLEGFSDGSGARVTIAQYFTPNGDPVHGVGIEPDFVVEDSGDPFRDSQLEKALELLEALPPVDELPATETPEQEQPAAP